MAQSKWKKVKVKVNGQMVDRWTDGKSYRLRRPAQSGAGIISNAAASAHKALGGGRGPSAGWKAAAAEQRNPRRSDGQISPRPSKAQVKSAAKAASSTPNTSAVDKAKAKKIADAAAARTAEIKKRAEAAAAAEKKRLADQRAGRGNTPPSAPRLPPPKKAAPAKKSAASTFRDKRDTKGLKIGRAFTLEEHQKLVKERNRKKSAAEKAGYPGQRNY